MVYENVKELRRAWDVWRLWEPLSGNEIGVLAKKKTVVTGIRWHNGSVVQPPNPNLKTGRGKVVTYMSYKEAYAHLGVLRCAEGGSAKATDKIEDKMLVPIKKLGGMRKPSRNEFNMCSEGLLGSLGEYYLQTVYVPFERLEKTERRWRSRFNRLFGRDQTSPIVELYTLAKAGP